MKQVIFRNWNFMRFLRLGLSIAIIIQSAMSGVIPKARLIEVIKYFTDKN